MINSLLAFFCAYLLGSFPSAYLAARAKGKNIFTLGSGNMGAMNIVRNLSWGWGIGVLAVDLLKGALATYLGLKLGGSDIVPALVASIGVVLGHCYSVFITFKGGKGLATALGISLPLYPWVGLSGLVILVSLSLSLRNRSNLAASILVASYPLLALIALHQQAWSGSSLLRTLVSIVCYCLIVLFKYLPDLRRELISNQKTDDT